MMMTHTVGVKAAAPTAMFTTSVPHPTRAPSADKASILVVDDDGNLLRMLQRSLVFAGYTVRVAEDGVHALRLALEQEPDLVVLDVMLPEPLDGLEVARRLRAGASVVPILMLTARDGLADTIAGFTSGADDYLAKPFEFEELLVRIGALLRRSHWSGSGVDQDQMLRYADLELNVATREAWRHGAQLTLTTREFDVLVFFLRHPRQVLTREQLFRGVWGGDYLGQSNVIDATISLLREKLEGGRPRLIQTVRGVGYALRQ
jgi:two-component system, OmpR family, response regulator MprA